MKQINWEKEWNSLFVTGFKLTPIQKKNNKLIISFIKHTLLSSQSAHDEEIRKRIEAKRKQYWFNNNGKEYMLVDDVYDAISSQSAHDEEIIERLEGMKKRKGKNRTTDEKRYPIGFNTALSDAISLIRGKQK